MRSQRIRTTLRVTPHAKMHHPGVVLRGWLQGRYSYLWFGDTNLADGSCRYCFGTLYGPRLYRLAKAIVRHFEKEQA